MFVCIHSRRSACCNINYSSYQKFLVLFRSQDTNDYFRMASFSCNSLIYKQKSNFWLKFFSVQNWMTQLFTLILFFIKASSLKLFPSFQTKNVWRYQLSLSLSLSLSLYIYIYIYKYIYIYIYIYTYTYINIYILGKIIYSLTKEP